MASISLIVPIFNGIRYLPHFFASLATAVPPDAQLILVDDASTEPVLDTLPSDFPLRSVVKLRLDQNRGYSAAVNHGFGYATGDILVQLNTDLVLDRHCIDTIVDLIERTPRIGIVGSKQLFPTTGLLSLGSFNTDLEAARDRRRLTHRKPQGIDMRPPFKSIFGIVVGR